MAVEKKRQFSLACTLLSRMVRERQGCFNGIPARPTTTTMNLLGGIDVSDTKKEEEEEEEKSESLTIFYGGKVFVFDDFPEEKAKFVMQMAKAQAAEELKQSAAGMMLAQTRKASLQRFLNKRKERINAKASPSLLKKKKMGAMALPEETRPWLALGH